MGKRRAKWDSLEGALHEIWIMLERGVTRSNDPFHWPVLGTTGESGASVRCVILRQFMLPERILVCYTDARAEKVKDIARSPHVSWLFYHPKRKVQLRISGRAILHGDDSFADERWLSTPRSNRINYCSTQPPSTTIDKPSTGLPDLVTDKVPALLDTEKGRGQFMAIACRIDTLDWLRLSILGNRRARFQWDENRLHATWLSP